VKKTGVAGFVESLMIRDGPEYMTGMARMQAQINVMARGYWPEWESVYRTGALETLDCPFERIAHFQDQEDHAGH
jgi:hypothetical protein